MAKGIDRQAIADVTQRGLVDKPAPTQQTIYVAGQKGYQDQQSSRGVRPRRKPNGELMHSAGR